MLTESQKQMVLDNIRLVDYVLYHKLNIRDTHYYYEDYKQEGRVGLILAVTRFDESKGASFSTYAVSYIEGFIKRFRRDYVYGRFKVPRTIKDLIHRVVGLYYNGHSYEEIKEELDITDEEYETVMSMINYASVNSVLGVDKDGHEYTLLDVLGVEDINLADVLGEETVFNCIERVADTLDKQLHKNIWYEYIYPLYLGERVTNLEIAHKYNISQPQVNRVLNKCKKLLIEYLKE